MEEKETDKQNQDRENKAKNKKFNAEFWKTVIKGSQNYVGLIVIPVLSGAGLGWWLDKKFQTEPWLFTVLVFLGFIVSIVNLVRSVK